MKSIKLSLSVAIALFISLTASADSSFVGKYGWNDGSTEVVVATVREAAEGLSIKFKGGCTAALELKGKAYVGECSSGTGYYDSIQFSARLTMKDGSPVLKWRGLEVGDSELGFDDFSAAVLLSN